MRLRAANVLLMALGTCFSSGPLHASGFPVVDIASVIQEVMQYVEIVEDAATQIDQLTTQEGSLLVQLDGWNQTLKEYEQKLRNLSKLGDTLHLDDPNLVTIFDDTMDVLSIVTLIDPSQAVFSQLQEVILAAEGYSPSRPELTHFNDQVAADQALLGRGGEAYRDQYDQYKRFQKGQAALTQASQDRQNKISDYQNRIENLGDESELATLQLQVGQTNMALLQNEGILTLLRSLRQAQEAEKMVDYKLHNLSYESRLRKANVRRNLTLSYD